VGLLRLVVLVVGGSIATVRGFGPPEAAAVSAASRGFSAGESGQAGMVLLGLLVAVVLGAVVLGGVARGVGVRGELQSAADLSAAGEYRGPFAHRQGKPMRPDVALAFDRMAAAARADAVALLITSAFRGDAEQARLFAAHPDPKWVAPPGRSLHRLGTELDLGPPAAYRWLAANAERFHF
jgi:hypothetical protein